MEEQTTGTGKAGRIALRLTDVFLAKLPVSARWLGLALRLKLPKTFRRHCLTLPPADFPTVRMTLRVNQAVAYGSFLMRAAWGKPSSAKSLLVAQVLAKGLPHALELVEALLSAVNSSDPEVLALLLGSVEGELPSEPVDEWARKVAVDRSNGIKDARTEDMLVTFLAGGYATWADRAGNGLLLRFMHPSLIDLFIKAKESGCNVETRNAKGDSLLHLATYGKADMSLLLPLLPKNLLECRNMDGLTPLHSAIRNAKPEKISVLTGAGADWSSETPRGWSALSMLSRMKVSVEDKSALLALATGAQAQKLMGRNNSRQSLKARASL